MIKFAKAEGFKDEVFTNSVLGIPKSRRPKKLAIECGFVFVVKPVTKVANALTLERLRYPFLDSRLDHYLKHYISFVATMRFKVNPAIYFGSLFGGR